MADKEIPMLNSVAPVGMDEGYRFYLCNGRANKHHSNELYPYQLSDVAEHSEPSHVLEIRGVRRAATDKLKARKRPHESSPIHAHVYL